MASSNKFDSLMSFPEDEIEAIAAPKTDISSSESQLQTLNELDNVDVPSQLDKLNTCTRSGSDRRQKHVTMPEGQERRSGRDRRLMTYF